MRPAGAGGPAEKSRLREPGMGRHDQNQSGGVGEPYEVIYD
jgi:hypothetical protein